MSKLNQFFSSDEKDVATCNLCAANDVVHNVSTAKGTTSGKKAHMQSAHKKEYESIQLAV